MNLKDKINKLDWTPKGEAKEIYDEFIKSPFYDEDGVIVKLLMCLVYEKQYDDAVQLSLDYINITKGDCSHIIYFFCGVAYDLLHNREKALWAYKKVLQYGDFLIVRHDQFGIKSCREFVEYLMENPYSPENVEKFDFSICNFERMLQRKLPVVKTPHFNIYYYPDSTAEKEIDIIKTQRETAYQKIAEYFLFTEDIKIDLYLFEDGDTKTKITGHTGAGWAYGRTMIEIYNEQVKLNPYHELVHVIVGYKYDGSISAMVEGFAVYLCNILDDIPAIDEISDAYDEKIRQFHKNGELFALKDLVYLDIGTEESNPYISYPQAASFVEFTIENLGKNKFIELYVSLNNVNSLDVIIEKIESAYKQKIDNIEKEWLNYAL